MPGKLALCAAGRVDDEPRHLRCERQAAQEPSGRSPAFPAGGLGCCRHAVRCNQVTREAAIIRGRSPSRVSKVNWFVHRAAPPTPHRKYRRTKNSLGLRTYRTRIDPFESVCDEIRGWLEVEPERTVKSVCCSCRTSIPASTPIASCAPCIGTLRSGEQGSS